MISGIKNLTRAVLPKASFNPVKNKESLFKMPEMVLHRMMSAGDKSIMWVDMNHCGAAIIKKDGVNTVFTDALNGCNSVGALMRLKDGRPLFMLSHYVPTNVEGQIKALGEQLKTYGAHIDKDRAPQLFLNLRGFNDYGKLEVVPNRIIDKVKELFLGFFKKEPEINITPYLNKNRPAYFSSANIFQFNPENLSQLKITNVGEVERFLDTTI